MSKDDLSAASRPKVGALATRTLTAAGYTTLDQLSCASASELLTARSVAAGDQDP